MIVSTLESVRVGGHCVFPLGICIQLNSDQWHVFSNTLKINTNVIFLQIKLPAIVIDSGLFHQSAGFATKIVLQPVRLYWQYSHSGGLLSVQYK